MHINRRTLLGSMGVAPLLSVAGLRRARAQASEPVRLPIMLPLSGPLALVGQPARMGAEITAELINKSGGILGRTLELEFFDDQAKPDQATSIARELVGKGATIIIGGQTTALSLAILPMLPETKTVFLAVAPTGLAFAHELYTPYFFRCVDNEYQRVRAQARLAADRFSGLLNWGAALTDAAVYRDDYATFGRLAGAAYGAKGRVPTFAEPVLAKFGGSDFRTQISAMTGGKFDAVYNQVSGSDAITFWQQARAMGLDNSIKLVMDMQMDVVTAKALKANLPPNLWTITLWNPALYPDNPISQALAKGYAARTNDTNPSGFMGFGHIAVIAAAEAIKATKGATDSDSIIRALTEIKFETAKGQVYFRPEDHQSIQDTGFINTVASDKEPGFVIADGYRVSGADIIEPPSPGVVFRP